VVGLGANLGACREAFRVAASRLPGEVEALSPLYQTAPLGPEQPDYLNAALRLRTDLEPRQLLLAMLEIERELGRDRSRETRWGPRTMDLDLLAWPGRCVAEDDLVVPHARLLERAFALAPLLDVWSDDCDVGGLRRETMVATLKGLGGAPPLALGLRVESATIAGAMLPDASSAKTAKTVDPARPRRKRVVRAPEHAWLDAVAMALVGGGEAPLSSGAAVTRARALRVSQPEVFWLDAEWGEGAAAPERVEAALGDALRGRRLLGAHLSYGSRAAGKQGPQLRLCTYPGEGGLQLERIFLERIGAQVCVQVVGID
jgi:2-amino-4-hydroxy-6-hydroxymethyldihydropteridine diphosphokinase